MVWTLSGRGAWGFGGVRVLRARTVPPSTKSAGWRAGVRQADRSCPERLERADRGREREGGGHEKMGRGWRGLPTQGRLAGATLGNQPPHGSKCTRPVIAKDRHRHENMVGAFGGLAQALWACLPSPA